MDDRDAAGAGAREPLSARLRREVDRLWDGQYRHPFVRGIADGTLEPGRFRHWLRQDYVFLIDYGRVIALAAARAPDLATMVRFAELLRETLVTEMALHRSYASGFGVSSEELERTAAAPTNRAYTDFLLRTAAIGDYLELLGALLPCMWGYSELGRRLASETPVSPNPYADWIGMYASSEFAELADWCRALLDRLAERASERAIRAASDAFIVSSRHELAFWQMAWTLEDSPSIAAP